MKQTKVIFWKLLQAYSIEIPTIQRDYTYGRTDAIAIGKKLTASIFDALCNQEALHLDFMYGKLEGKQNFEMLEKNKQSIESLLSSIKTYAIGLHLQVEYKAEKQSTSSTELITFIPLDGQQRLTTLFLIHWYLAAKAGETEALTRFANFTYSTRQSSKKFLEFLCYPEFVCLLSDKKSIRKAIENHELFFPFWKKDPTVHSMLFILETIEGYCRTNDVNVHDAWNALTKDSLIHFDFFDLDDFELTDELYVKMNARGKALTDFENFKAWLVKTYDFDNQIAGWKKKLDIDWNDLFWKRRLKNQTKIDTAYLQFFMNMFLSDYLMETYSSDTPDYKINTDPNLDILRNAESGSKKIIRPIDIFQGAEIFGNHVCDYFTLLDALTIEDPKIDLNPHFVESSLAEFLLINKNLTWWDHTYQYALTRFIIKYQENLEHLQTWTRIVGNLIYNSSIETASLHRDACEGINKILNEIGDQDILSAIASLSDSGYGLAEKQVREEQTKAKIILDQPEHRWSELFASLEQHHYFYGQISFILEITGEVDFDSFQKTAEKVSAMFSKEVMEDNSYALFRACLAIQNVIPVENQVLYYPSNARGTVRQRNENWRRYITQNLKILKSLISHNSFNQYSLPASLEDVVQNTNFNSEIVELLSVDPDNLRYPKKNQIRFFRHTCLLLSSSRISGYAVELYTFHWFNNRNHFSKFPTSGIEYHYGKGTSDIPGLLLSKGNKKHKIICDRNMGGFQILEQEEQSSNLSRFKSINDAIESITK